MYCDIKDVKASTSMRIIQGRILVKSELSKTKYKTNYFWCLIADKKEKYTPQKTEPNQIKIMFWHPFANKFYPLLKKGQIYDFTGFAFKKSNPKYNDHSYQLVTTENSKVKRKDELNVLRKGMLCNERINEQSSCKLQVNIRHYFRAS